MLQKFSIAWQLNKNKVFKWASNEVFSIKSVLEIRFRIFPSIPVTKTQTKHVPSRKVCDENAFKLPQKLFKPFLSMNLQFKVRKDFTWLVDCNNNNNRKVEKLDLLLFNRETPRKKKQEQKQKQKHRTKHAVTKARNEGVDFVISNFYL